MPLTKAPIALSGKLTIHALREFRDEGEPENDLSVTFDAQTFTEEEKAFLLTCVCLLREDDGAGTPSESLLFSLISCYGIQALAPHDLEAPLEEFRSNYERLLPNVRKALADYPSVFKKP